MFSVNAKHKIFKLITRKRKPKM
uniref:Uncharacterized protein n=1 Tax=Arundo donax TaxID=35708 RepID=A0A0A9H9F6_ARUDO